MPAALPAAATSSDLIQMTSLLTLSDNVVCGQDLQTNEAAHSQIASLNCKILLCKFKIFL